MLLAVPLVGLLVMVVFTVLAFAASGRLKRGLIGLAVFLGILTLLGFPVGTAFGVLILLGVFDKESREWLARQRHGLQT